ncbi:hypothetical protein J6590_004905 [Homalodisca vitripennis]|nr:hypothetical protein J6590_004905 [Homalodisca vitripennis]
MKRGGNPFQNLDKTSVLQEARTFNDTPVNPRKCTHILTKILYLLNQGEQLGSTEATEVFFAMTKLFQSRDVVLRRMVYLGIKELSSLAEDVIIVTSSLTKDMTGQEDLYRAAAIRALCSITDATMLQTIERYMKQAIVERNSAVSSAALVSSLHLTRVANDVVKRWVNEAQEAVNSDNMMVQYHGLGVLYHIRKSDRLAVTKLVAKLTRVSLKSPFAVCMLIRIVCKLLEEEGGEFADSPLFEFVESCLRHKSETVIYEAAHAIVNLKQTTQRELAPAVSVLQLFCSSPKPTLRFAAVRTLNKVAMSHPAAVTACNLDLENLITDSNRSIATLAITTLLKTGAESSVDRLMKQIASFVSEISDEFKIVVIQQLSLSEDWLSTKNLPANLMGEGDSPIQEFALNKISDDELIVANKKSGWLKGEKEITDNVCMMQIRNARRGFESPVIPIGFNVLTKPFIQVDRYSHSARTPHIRPPRDRAPGRITIRPDKPTYSTQHLTKQNNCTSRRRLVRATARLQAVVNKFRYWLAGIGRINRGAVKPRPDMRGSTVHSYAPHCLAIRALCLKFPRKHSVLMNFLSAMLRDEGGLEYKASIADTVITIIEENPDAKETGETFSLN